MKIIFLKYKIIFNIKISKQSKNTKRIIFKQKNKKKHKTRFQLEKQTAT
jgi:hypothetical protein